MAATRQGCFVTIVRGAFGEIKEIDSSFFRAASSTKRCCGYRAQRMNDLVQPWLGAFKLKHVLRGNIRLLFPYQGVIEERLPLDGNAMPVSLQVMNLQGIGRQ